MKLLFLVCLFTFCLFSLVQSQSMLVWEFSLSGSMGSSSEKVDQSGTQPMTAAAKYFSLAFRPGFLVSGPLEFEPELSVTGQTGQLPLYAGSANFSYNIILSKSAGMILFPLAGYGTARGAASRPSLYSFTQSPKLSLVNLGLGLKLLVTRNAGLRVEGRFQRYSGKLPGTSARYTDSVSNLFFGFSFFF